MGDEAMLHAQGWAQHVPFLKAGGHKPLLEKVAALRAKGQVIFPPQGDVLQAFASTSWDATRVLIVGQDPYHGAGQAHGLAFSVRENVATPRSLQNIFKEIARDTGQPSGLTLPPSPCLTRWAEQGVLLLNTVLSVEEGKAHSHIHVGWQALTTAVLTALAQRPAPLAVLLWGNAARLFAPLFAESPLHAHLVLQAAHPSPLSASRGFHGCGHFSAVNAWLKQQHQKPITW